MTLTESIADALENLEIDDVAIEGVLKIAATFLRKHGTVETTVPMMRGAFDGATVSQVIDPSLVRPGAVIPVDDPSKPIAVGAPCVRVVRWEDVERVYGDLRVLVDGGDRSPAAYTRALRDFYDRLQKLVVVKAPAILCKAPGCAHAEKDHNLWSLYGPGQEGLGCRHCSCQRFHP